MSSGGRKSTYRWGISSFLVSDVIASTVGSPPHFRPTTGAPSPAAKADLLSVSSRAQRLLPFGYLPLALEGSTDSFLSFAAGSFSISPSGQRQLPPEVPIFRCHQLQSVHDTETGTAVEDWIDFGLNALGTCVVTPVRNQPVPALMAATGSRGVTDPPAC